MNIVPSKLRYFHDRGIKIRGVIHVGMSWGEEIADYLDMGATHVIGFEPTNDAFAEAVKLYGDDPRVKLQNYALGSAPDDDAVINVIVDKEPMVGHPVGTGGSTLLRELVIPEGTRERVMRFPQMTRVARFDSLGFNMEDYNALVIDVQGMELEVLRGFGDLLKHIDCANIECSRVPVYEGEASAGDVIMFMNEHGFRAVTPIEDHDDILFSRI